MISQQQHGANSIPTMLVNLFFLFSTANLLALKAMVVLLPLMGSSSAEALRGYGDDGLCG